MPAKKIKPQTPGAQTETDKMPPQEVEEIVEDVAEEEVSDKEITLTQSQLEDLVSDMVEKRVVSEVKAARRKAELAKSPMEEDLPDAKEIDASKIKRAVLTKQGWVCPLVHPSDRLRMEKKA